MPVEATEEVKLPPIGAAFRGPGPGKYLLPTSVGYNTHTQIRVRCPQYSFGLKSRADFTDKCGPGPGKYRITRVTKGGNFFDAAYTMSTANKRKTLLDTAYTPGPGQYSPEKVSPPKERKAPSYSFGSRTMYAKKDATPSPNSYGLPTLVGPKIPNKNASAAYSFTGRSKIGGFSEDLQKTPGPGTYRVTAPDINKNKAAQYSMNGRNFLPGDATLKPGPGAHSPEKVVIHKTRAPIVSLGIRHSEYTCPLIVNVGE